MKKELLEMHKNRNENSVKHTEKDKEKRVLLTFNKKSIKV